METQRRSARVAVGLAAAATLGLVIGAAPTAVAQPQAAAPQVVVDPATGLPGTAEVKVGVSGFKPGAAVFVQQCAQVSSTVLGCDWGRTGALVLDDAGSGTAQLTVSRVFVAHDENGDLIGEVDCASTGSGCFVAVGNRSGGSGAVISFA